MSSAFARSTTSGHLLWASKDLSYGREAFSQALAVWAAVALPKLSAQTDGTVEWDCTWPHDKTQHVSIAVSQEGAELLWFISPKPPAALGIILSKRIFFFPWCWISRRWASGCKTARASCPL